MSAAYSPGLTVSAYTTVRRVRRLTIKGEVLVDVGDRVEPDTPVARALLPGLMQSVKVANALGIDAEEAAAALVVKPADEIARGQVVAQTNSFFGLFKSECRSPVSGTFEIFSHANGSLGIRQPPTPVEVKAYLSGAVDRLIPQEGVVISSQAALIQGIFGVGGERSGVLRCIAGSSADPVNVSQIDESLAGCIFSGGSHITAEALAKAVQVGVAGIVVGGVTDAVLAGFLGFDIGVAITGDEDTTLTLMVTEGFGSIPMADRTFSLLQELDGKVASINGATQIRAGVIRPELVVPRERPSSVTATTFDSTLSVGAAVRIVREPYFGDLATVSALPSQLQTVESGATVRVLQAVRTDGGTVTVPRANVELIESH